MKTIRVEATSFCHHMLWRLGLMLGSSLLAVGAAHAHAEAGDRLFPATLAIDDPGVTDELSLPTFARSVGADGTIENDIGFELDKTVTETFEIIVGDRYSHFSDGRSGLQNLELGAKYNALLNPEHEFLLTFGFLSEVGGTGATSIAEKYSSVGPQVYFGKGFGDLPTSLNVLRPFAITSQIGLAFPTQNYSFTPIATGTASGVSSTLNPSILNWGFSLQYSLLYINEHMHELDAPDVFKHLIPTVEVALETPVASIPAGGHTTTGTVNPGVFYVRETYQIGVEAMLPINEASGKHPGFIAQLHFFLEGLFPDSLGRPIFR